jgi:hypothetical protein
LSFNSFQNWCKQKNRTNFQIHGWDAIPLISRILYKEDDALMSLKFIELCKKIILQENKHENINYLSLKGHGKIENR